LIVLVQLIFGNYQRRQCVLVNLSVFQLMTACQMAVGDESGLPTRGGQEVINRQFLSFLGQAVSEFSQYKMNVSEVILPANTVRQVWFKVEGRETQIRMTVDRSAQAQVKQVIATLSYLDNNGAKPGYIDVRVDQKILKGLGDNFGKFAKPNAAKDMAKIILTTVRRQGRRK
jgi:hypothetical protein